MADALSAIDAADYVVLTAGRFDVIAEVVCTDHSALVDLLGSVRAIDGVHTVETLTYLGLVKQTYDWGVG